MFDSNALWRERLGRTSRELGKYLRYIFNGHIVIVLVFLLGTAAFYYQGWIKTLSPDFPAEIIMAVILALLLTYSPIYTFLMEADKVFLLPLESKLANYFTKSFWISFFIQVYMLLLGLGVFMPMYAQVNQGDFRSFFFFLATMGFTKMINLMIRWRIQYFTESNIHNMDTFIRYCVNTVLLYFLFSNAGVFFVGPILLLLVLLYLFYRSQTKGKAVKWEKLIELDERRMMSFYRLANLFTDVPKLKDRVKRRKWLDLLVNRISFGQKNTYLYLFVITFLRGGDYLGLLIRLTVIGAGFLYLVSFGLGQIIIVILFIFLTGFQLLPLWNHHQNKLWVQLYPVSSKVKGKAFQTVLSRVLYIQSILLSIPLTFKEEWGTALLSIICGLVFSYMFVYIYSKNKVKI